MNITTLKPQQITIANQVTYSGRELHSILEVKSKYAHWIKRTIARARLEIDSEYKVCGVVNDTASKINTSLDDHYLTMDSAIIIASMSDSDIGNQVRRTLIAIKNKYFEEQQLKLTNQATIIKGLVHEGSLSSQAKQAGYLTALEIKELLNLKTGSNTIRRVSDYSAVPIITVGSYTFYQVTAFIKAWTKWVEDSELATVNCSVTYRHILSNWIYEI